MTPSFPDLCLHLQEQRSMRQMLSLPMNLPGLREHLCPPWEIPDLYLSANSKSTVSLLLVYA